MMMSDASEMLAAALEQMDGIIAGSKAMDYSNGLFSCQSPSSPLLGGLRALHLLDDLRGALELMEPEERAGLRCQIPEPTAQGLVEWLQGGCMTNGHGSTDAVYQERLSRLESNKECLVLQVSVLTDQVEVQGEKIRDLDTCLEEHRQKLSTAEALLHQELLNRSALETRNLELMTEVSSLQMKLTAVERDHRDTEGLYQEVTGLRFRVTDIENERLQCERKLKATNDNLLLLQGELDRRDEELRRLKAEEARLDRRSPEPADRDAELLQIKSEVQYLASANDEKERRIEELQESLMQYKKVQQLVNEKLNEDDYDDILEEPSAPVTMDTEQVAVAIAGEAGRGSGESTPCIAVLSEMNELDRERQLHSWGAESSQDSIQTGSLCLTASSPEQAEYVEAVSPTSPTKPSSAGDESFGTKKMRSSFGRGFFKMRGGKRTASSPDLASQPQRRTDHLDLAGVTSGRGTAASCSPEAKKKKTRGFRGFFGRLKQSHSTSLTQDHEPDAEFKRGGVRATAGPRLGWSREPTHAAKCDVPFAQWGPEQVCDWLQEQGLGLYAAQGRGWLRSGQTLLQASQHDLEKELGVRHHLHRKKLRLALRALGQLEEDVQGRLDHNWVTRWLDDIGLPQYKSHFEEGRVDGRMLHHMTVDDLLALKVGSVLHHLSIKRAVQVLRLNLYEPGCLRRRPSDENSATPAEISQWTNHRVMEWLRSVDLAEYAPNLRGSGVHGGLMVLEPRFTVETLALLLNIPPSKTLLRRHLATHFQLLVGPDAQRLKQACLENPDHVALTATARVKPRRLSFGGFGTLRRRRQEDHEEYVCPLDLEMPKHSSFQKLLRIYEDNLDQLEQLEDSEGAVREIGAFSEGINNLTIMLKDDAFLSEDSECSPDKNASM